MTIFSLWLTFIIDTLRRWSRKLSQKTSRKKSCPRFSCTRGTQTTFRCTMNHRSRIKQAPNNVLLWIAGRGSSQELVVTHISNLPYEFLVTVITTCVRNWGSFSHEASRFQIKCKQTFDRILRYCNVTIPSQNKFAGGSIRFTEKERSS